MSNHDTYFLAWCQHCRQFLDHAWSAPERDDRAREHADSNPSHFVLMFSSDGFGFIGRSR